MRKQKQSTELENQANLVRNFAKTVQKLQEEMKTKNTNTANEIQALTDQIQTLNTNTTNQIQTLNTNTTNQIQALADQIQALNNNINRLTGTVTKMKEKSSTEEKIWFWVSNIFCGASVGLGIAGTLTNSQLLTAIAVGVGLGGIIENFIRNRYFWF